MLNLDLLINTSHGSHICQARCSGCSPEMIIDLAYDARFAMFTVLSASVVINTKLLARTDKILDAKLIS